MTQMMIFTADTQKGGKMDEDRCYECGGYGDDYYYDDEKDEYVKACDECPYNETWRCEDD